MIPKNSTIRIARPTDNLEIITEQYVNGLGFKVLDNFLDHDGFDGVIIGNEIHPYHLEFTHHRGTQVGGAPTKDSLMVFYITDENEWHEACCAMSEAKFKIVDSYNPYWDIFGKTFEDFDGYRVVLQNE